MNRFTTIKELFGDELSFEFEDAVYEWHGATSYEGEDNRLCFLDLSGSETLEEVGRVHLVGDIHRVHRLFHVKCGVVPDVLDKCRSCFDFNRVKRANKLIEGIDEYDLDLFDGPFEMMKDYCSLCNQHPASEYHFLNDCTIDLITEEASTSLGLPFFHRIELRPSIFNHQWAKPKKETNRLGLQYDRSLGIFSTLGLYFNPNDYRNWDDILD